MQDVDMAEEPWLARVVCCYITDMLAARNSYGCYYSYDDDATVSRYSSIIWTLNTYYDQSIVFSKGHRGFDYGLHITLVDHFGENVIDYSHILVNTSNKFRFAFIWHCQTAQYYPWDPEVDEIPYGMPYCWTHDNSMGTYGHSGDRVFLGWWPGPYDGSSPQFYTFCVDELWNYGHVAYLFWYHMCEGYSVAQTFEFLAQTVYNQQYFSDTELHDWLMAWGNVDMTLPNG